jgi:hypothetical protein
MRKLLLIAVTLALGTLAWAQADMNTANDEQTGNDFYNQVLSGHVDRFAAQNDAISPSAQMSEPQASENELPGSISSNEAQQDWYGQKVAAEADSNLRTEKAEIPGNL